MKGIKGMGKIGRLVFPSIPITLRVIFWGFADPLWLARRRKNSKVKL
jgi:hypothetical protein